ncbi:FadR/GntR family transcriptional regulator [Ramlibacter sp.]|uniref:FadR/GntR family transcriptional regulator n=1 Tax=Ramlibacter sp. TaxID=1917967 RepID=UPI003D0DCD4A
MAQLGPIRIQKGFESLAEALAEQILTGKIKAGELLPNERDLGEVSGLSRGSVREALRVLEAQGLVSTKLGRNGGRVASPAADETFRRSIDFFIRGQRISLAVMMETVEVLEPNLAQLAAKNRDDADIERLRAASKKLRETSTPGRFVNANVKWHSEMAKASHNPLLIAIHDSFGPELLNPRIAGFISPEIRASVVHAVERIELAIVEGDTEAARRRMARLVEAYRTSVEAASARAASKASAIE